MVVEDHGVETAVTVVTVRCTMAAVGVVVTITEDTLINEGAGLDLVVTSGEATEVIN